MFSQYDHRYDCRFIGSSNTIWNTNPGTEWYTSYQGSRPDSIPWIVMYTLLVMRSRRWSEATTPLCIYWSPVCRCLWEDSQNVCPQRGFIKKIFLLPLCIRVCALSFVPRSPPMRKLFRPLWRLWKPLICTSIHLWSRPKPFWVRGSCWWYVYEYIWYVEVPGSPVAYVWIYECVRTLCDVRMAYLGGYIICCCCCCCLHITTYMVRVVKRDTSIQALWSRNHDTEILLVRCNAVSRVDNALTERGKETNMHELCDDVWWYFVLTFCLQFTLF